MTKEPLLVGKYPPKVLNMGDSRCHIKSSPSNRFQNFLNQLPINAITTNTVILGDFNLDARMSNIPEYHRKVPLDKLNTFTLNANLHQLVKECTWSRIINGHLKESLLDHIYTTKPENVLKINYSVPTFGDHKFIFIELNFFAPLNVSTFYRREWSHYDQYLINDKMKHELLLLNNVIEDELTVNEFWNLLESVLIKTIDLVAPLSEVKISAKTKRTDMALHIKGKITKRKRLLHYNRINNCSLRISEIKVLNKEINNYFESKRAGNVRKVALGPNTNIWKAVKLAKSYSSVHLLLPSDNC